MEVNTGAGVFGVNELVNIEKSQKVLFMSTSCAAAVGHKLHGSAGKNTQG